MLDQDEGHAAVGRQVGEELLESFQPAGRGADTDDGEAGCADVLRGGHFC